MPMSYLRNLSELRFLESDPTIARLAAIMVAESVIALIDFFIIFR